VVALATTGTSTDGYTHDSWNGNPFNLDVSKHNLLANCDITSVVHNVKPHFDLTPEVVCRGHDATLKHRRLAQRFPVSGSDDTN